MQGTLLHDVSLADYTSWRVGGKTKQLYKPLDLTDLSAFIAQLPTSEKIMWLGLGSNTLIRDNGFDGTVIITQGTLNALSIEANQCVRAESGVACATMARFSARHDLKNAEFLAGIPGTMGGALRMNAGCFGGETWPLVKEVEVMNRQGKIKTRPVSDYSYSYRTVELPTFDEWFIAGHFQLAKGNKQQSLDMIRQLLDRRTLTQPTSEHSCGSVFRNPPDDFAARLIETAALKGKRIGGAFVSKKHANFIINDGTATAKDIEDLILFVKNEVKHHHGILLQTEVHIVGNR